MYSGHLDKRFMEEDPNGLLQPLRERTEYETLSLERLFRAEQGMRQMLDSLSHNVDPRSIEQAYAKLDELVMWAKRGIDQ